MNIFYLDPDPDICAQYHNDKHVVKMILETAQMLCTAHHRSFQQAPYRPVHKNHPCVLWACRSKENYNWLRELGLSLSREYTFRYGKSHKSEDVILKMDKAPDIIPSIGFTTPYLAMPDKYKTDDPVESYRNYYIEDKSHIAKWKNRDVPYWYKIK